MSNCPKSCCIKIKKRVLNPFLQIASFMKPNLKCELFRLKIYDMRLLNSHLHIKILKGAKEVTIQRNAII